MVARGQPGKRWGPGLVRKWSRGALKGVEGCAHEVNEESGDCAPRRRRTRTNNGCSQPQLPRGIFQSYKSRSGTHGGECGPLGGHACGSPRSIAHVGREADLRRDERH